MIEQRSAEHSEHRAGKITGSVVRKLMNGTIASWASLRKDMENPRPFYDSTSVPSLAWGIKHEPNAIAAYELQTGLETEARAFIPHPVFDLVGASPDRLVPPNGGLEAKCPYDRNEHMKVIYSNAIPQIYIPQIHLNIACAEADWWDFASYDPRSIGSMRLVIIRQLRDDDYLARMNERIQQFLEFLDAGGDPDPTINPATILKRLKF